MDGFSFVGINGKHTCAPVIVFLDAVFVIFSSFEFLPASLISESEKKSACLFVYPPPTPFLPFLEMEKVVCLFSPFPTIPATRRRRKEITVYTIFLLLRFRTAKERERERNLEVLAIVFGF